MLFWSTNIQPVPTSLLKISEYQNVTFEERVSVTESARNCKCQKNCRKSNLDNRYGGSNIRLSQCKAQPQLPGDNSILIHFFTCSDIATREYSCLFLFYSHQFRLCTINTTKLGPAPRDQGMWKKPSKNKGNLLSSSLFTALFRWSWLREGRPNLVGIGTVLFSSNKI